MHDGMAVARSLHGQPVKLHALVEPLYYVWQVLSHSLVFYCLRGKGHVTCCEPT